MKIEILVGPIASGKSTYCKIAAKQGAVIVNDDAIVTLIHADDYTLYDKSLKPLYKVTENAILQTALTMGRKVIVDRPNHSIRMRRRYIGLAHSLDAEATIVMFKRESPAVHAKRRVNSDARGHDLAYWTMVAESHDLLYEAPNKQIEQFDSLCYWDHESQAIKHAL